MSYTAAEWRAERREVLGGEEGEREYLAALKHLHRVAEITGAPPGADVLKWALHLDGVVQMRTGRASDTLHAVDGLTIARR